MSGETVIIEEQLSVLEDLAKEYSGKTIENIISQLKSKLKEFNY